MSSKNSSVLLLVIVVAMAIVTLLDPVGAGLYLVYILSALVAVVSIGSFVFRMFVDFKAVKKFLISTAILAVLAGIFYSITEAKPTMGLVNDTIQELADAKTTQFTGGVLGLALILMIAAIVMLVTVELRALFNR